MTTPACLADCTAENCSEFNFAAQVKECKVVDVYDGDTCKVCFPVGPIYYKFAVRMYGYNCHEMKQRRNDPNAKQNKELAIKARDHLRSLILGRCVFMQCLEQDKYGRILGKLFLDSNMSPESCVNTMMLAAGHGFEYYGVGNKLGEQGEAKPE